MSKRVYIVGGGGGAYEKMFQHYGWTVVEEARHADLLQFTGGEDVSPILYHTKEHPRTFNNLDRDLREMRIFYNGIANDRPMAGICRGGQFLNVMCGGTMYQHVNNHAIHGTHKITTHDGKVLQVSSTHHQMMREGINGDVLAHAGDLSTKREYINPNGAFLDDGGQAYGGGPDTEVILYPLWNVLCFQPHPEMSAYDEQYRECADYYFECLKLIEECC